MKTAIRRTSVGECECDECDVMPRFKTRSSAHTSRKRYVWMQIYFKHGKKISIIENTRIRVDDQIQFKNATCGRRSFLNMEGKISVFESIRLGVNKTLLIFTQICACVTNNLWNVLDYQTRHENVQSLRTNFGQVFFSVQKEISSFFKRCFSKIYVGSIVNLKLLLLPNRVIAF